MTRTSLFNEANKLFGTRALATALVRNPDRIRTDEDMHKIINEVEGIISQRKKDLIMFEHCAGMWLADLAEALRTGKLKELS